MKNRYAVELAQDVLSQLQTRQIIPIVGQYAEDTGKNLIRKAMGLAIGMREEPCSVCAVGALFLKRLEAGNPAAIRFALKHRSLWAQNRTHFIKVLADAFSVAEMNAIETAYESRVGWGDMKAPPVWAARWYSMHPDNGLRMAAIMLAIVRDGGRFTAKTPIPTKAAAQKALDHGHYSLRP